MLEPQLVLKQTKDNNLFTTSSRKALVASSMAKVT